MYIFHVFTRYYKDKFICKEKNKFFLINKLRIYYIYKSYVTKTISINTFASQCLYFEENK